jgi:hypothetical protein
MPEPQYCKACQDERHEYVPASYIENGFPSCRWCHKGLAGPHDPMAKLYNLPAEEPTVATPVQSPDADVTATPREGF